MNNKCNSLTEMLSFLFIYFPHGFSRGLWGVACSQQVNKFVQLESYCPFINHLTNLCSFLESHDIFSYCMFIVFFLPYPLLILNNNIKKAEAYKPLLVLTGALHVHLHHIGALVFLYSFYYSRMIGLLIIYVICLHGNEASIFYHSIEMIFLLI